jgi:CheY-like chemotaxis protein
VHPRAAEDLPSGSERILIVDDNESARVAIARILTRLGYSAKEVPDGDKALAWIRSGAGIDLLLTDLIMPGMSGFTLTERVENEFGPIRVLYMSGEFHGAVSWGGAPGSLVGFLEKPMTPADLARGVRRLLDVPLDRRSPT